MSVALLLLSAAAVEMVETVEMGEMDYKDLLEPLDM